MIRHDCPCRDQHSHKCQRNEIKLIGTGKPPISAKQHRPHHIGKDQCQAGNPRPAAHGIHAQTNKGNNCEIGKQRCRIRVTATQNQWRTKRANNTDCSQQWPIEPSQNHRYPSDNDHADHARCAADQAIKHLCGQNGTEQGNQTRACKYGG